MALHVSALHTVGPVSILISVMTATLLTQPGPSTLTHPLDSACGLPAHPHAKSPEDKVTSHLWVSCLPFNKLTPLSHPGKPPFVQQDTLSLPPGSGPPGSLPTLNSANSHHSTAPGVLQAVPDTAWPSSIILLLPVPHAQAQRARWGGPSHAHDSGAPRVKTALQGSASPVPPHARCSTGV